MTGKELDQVSDIFHRAIMGELHAAKRAMGTPAALEHLRAVSVLGDVERRLRAELVVTPCVVCGSEAMAVPCRDGLSRCLQHGLAASLEATGGRDAAE